MNNSDLKQIWLEKFKTAPQTLSNLKKVEAVGAAFNTNIDAVLKLSGEKLLELIRANGLTWDDLSSVSKTRLDAGVDVLKGIFKCFSRGIAEEWIAEDITVYNWMVDNLGYDRLQMGGQCGIVSNALGACGVRRMYVHANSLPKLQADQFLPLNNIRSFDELGTDRPAYQINRVSDIPLIHWIIEFDRGDKIELDGHVAICPKANRFIATYDPLNLNLVIDNNFLDNMKTQKLDFAIISGFHALTAENNGQALIDKAYPLLKGWKKDCPDCIFHIELASTQDIVIRKAIVEKIAPMMESIGVNERETIDVLEIIGEQALAQKCDLETTSENLFKGILKLKENIGAPRIQLHMFGLYITVQDKSFKLSPENNLQGMMTAACVAAHKAKIGNIDNCGCDPLWSYDQHVSDIGLDELKTLADFIGDENLIKTGIGEYEGYDVIALPTIIVEKPVTLVGMGDTISSISLVASK